MIRRRLWCPSGRQQTPPWYCEPGDRRDFGEQNLDDCWDIDECCLETASLDARWNVSDQSLGLTFFYTYFVLFYNTLMP